MTASERTFLKIHGLSNSGTNLLAWVLRHHIEDAEPLSLILGWKHGPLLDGASALDPRGWFDPAWLSEADGALFTPHMGFVQAYLDSEESRALIAGARAAYLAGEVKYVFVTRDPLVWLSRSSGFMSAVQENWATVAGRWGTLIDVDALRHLTDPLIFRAKYWSCIHAQWLQRRPKGAVFVRFEDLVRDAPSVSQTISEALGLRLGRQLPTCEEGLVPGQMDEIRTRPPEFVPPGHRAAPTHAATAEPEEQRVFRAALDLDVCRALGYPGAGDPQRI